MKDSRGQPPASLALPVDLAALAVFALLFFLLEYASVSGVLPSSVPVHHDDYTNYAAGAAWMFSWVRPLSSYAIHALAAMGPDWLINGVRVLAIVFVFLCWKLFERIARPAHYWPTLVAFGIGCLSTPVAAEYGRYTGMITHLLSGCLGMAAAGLLFLEPARRNASALAASALAIVLSALAKEDFLLFYGLALAYAAIRAESGQRRAMLAWGGAGLLVSLAMVAGVKFGASSSFLAGGDDSAPYRIVANPLSVATVAWSYLGGGGHPAMATHGQVIRLCFLCAAAMAALGSLRARAPTPAAFFLLAALTLIAPYSVLPNHVNAYYELIWLPMLLASFYCGSMELASWRLPDGRAASAAGMVFFLLIGALAVLDFPGRKSIAAWYDSVGANNRRNLQVLRWMRPSLQGQQDVCVTGADSFSPWFMHDGGYLRNVVGLDTRWHLKVSPDAPQYAGLRAGADASAGRTLLESSLPVGCPIVPLSSTP
jgi:hypothetical protein